MCMCWTAGIGSSTRQVKTQFEHETTFGMLQPRNASLEKSQCGLAGGAAKNGAERRQRRAAESFCGICSLAHQARQLFDFFCRTFGHQPCILLQIIIAIITNLSPFLYVAPLKNCIVLIKYAYVGIRGLIFNRKARGQPDCNACAQSFTPPFPQSPQESPHYQPPQRI